MGSQHKWGRYRLLTKYTHLQHSPVTKSITEDIYVNLDVLWSEGCVTRLLACLLLIRAAQELPILYLLLFLTLCRSVKPPTGAFLQTSKLKYQQSSCQATFPRVGDAWRLAVAPKIEEKDFRRAEVFERWLWCTDGCEIMLDLYHHEPTSPFGFPGRLPSGWRDVMLESSPDVGKIA